MTRAKKKTLNIGLLQRNNDGDPRPESRAATLRLWNNENEIPTLLVLFPKCSSLSLPSPRNAAHRGVNTIGCGAENTAGLSAILSTRLISHS